MPSARPRDPAEPRRTPPSICGGPGVPKNLTRPGSAGASGSGAAPMNGGASRRLDSAKAWRASRTRPREVGARDPVPQSVEVEEPDVLDGGEAACAHELDRQAQERAAGRAGERALVDVEGVVLLERPGAPCALEGAVERGPQPGIVDPRAGGGDKGLRLGEEALALALRIAGVGGQEAAEGLDGEGRLLDPGGGGEVHRLGPVPVLQEEALEALTPLASLGAPVERVHGVGGRPREEDLGDGRRRARLPGRAARGRGPPRGSCWGCPGGSDTGPSRSASAPTTCV